MFLFPLNVGVSPCFHCTVLVSIYRVYTSYFHNTVASSCYRLHTYVCMMQVLLLVSVWACGFILLVKCVISQKLMRECTYTVELVVSLLYVFIWWDVVSTSLWGKLYPVPTGMLIVTMISIRIHSVLKKHSFYR